MNRYEKNKVNINKKRHILRYTKPQFDCIIGGYKSKDRKLSKIL